MNKHASRSLFYLVATIMPRVLGIILLPIYSHFLLPQQYGIFSLSNTINQILYMVMTFGLVSAVGRFYFDAPDEEQRRLIMGQISIFLFFVPLACLGLLEWQGDALFQLFTPGVSYAVYFRIVAWTTFLSMFSVVPLMVLRSQERAILFASMTIGQAVLYHALAIVLVTMFGYGVIGLLWSNFISTLLLVPLYINLVLPMISLKISFQRVKELLKYSTPLIPHSVAGWVLSLSDRIVLQRWASLADIGVYSLGYTLGSSVQNVADAVNASWFPSFYRSQTTGKEVRQTLRMATYLLAVVCATAFLVAVGGHHFVLWFLPKSYAGAEKVIVWVAASAIFILLYYIWSFSIHYSKKTWYLPVVTWSAALLNLATNFILIPKFGYIAAAFNTFLAYFLMAIVCSFIACKLYPIQYEYRRWIVLVTTTVIMTMIVYFRPELPTVWDIVYSFILLSAWPLILGFLRFYNEAEKEFYRTWLDRLMRSRLSTLP